MNLAVCDPELWAEPDRPGGDMWMLKAWTRWVEARIEHLKRLGYTSDEAQLLAVGDYPEGIDRA